MVNRVICYKPSIDITNTHLDLTHRPQLMDTIKDKLIFKKGKQLTIG